MNIDKFKHDHAVILGRVGELRRLVQAGAADNAPAIANLVVSISAIIKLHLSSEDRVLYPALSASSDSAAVRTAERFKSEMGAIAAAYSEFSRKWILASRVAAEPEAFREDANRVFKALHERIQRENRELYPLAERV